MKYRPAAKISEIFSLCFLAVSIATVKNYSALPKFWIATMKPSMKLQVTVSNAELDILAVQLRHTYLGIHLLSLSERSNCSSAANRIKLRQRYRECHMGLGSEMPEVGAQTPQRSTSEGNKLVPKSSPEKWKLGVLESGLNGEGEKANDATPTSSENDDLTTYPEGGLRAWLVVFGSWCALVASLGTASSFGSYQAYFIEFQLSSYSPGAVGWIFSVYAFLAFAGGFLTGPAFDKFGPKMLVLAGSILVCLSMFLVGLCKRYWQFLVVFGFLGGGGSGLLYTPAVASIGHYFKRTRGNAIGIAFSSSAIGGVAFPLMLQHLIPKVGFAWSTRIIGCMNVCLCVIAFILISSRLPRAKNSNAKPDFRIFNETAFAITVVAVFLLQWAYFVPVSYINSYALYQGFSSAFASQALMFLNLGSIFGRWLPGFTGDKIGHYNSILVMAILTAVSVLGVWLPAGQTKAGLIVFALIFGFTSGSILTLTAACIGQLCQTKNYGRYYSTAYTIASVGYLTGIPIGGELVSISDGDYGSLIVFVGLCYTAAVAALVMVRILQTGWKIMVVY